MKITVNGRSHEIAEAITVAVLLEQLDVPMRGVAVEVNERLVPRANHAETRLDDGDHVEVVTLVGGG